MKYILYRSFGDLDKDIKKHELVAVEIGKNIDASIASGATICNAVLCRGKSGNREEKP